MLINAIQNPSAQLKRALGLLLVIFIFYGTTVEAAHRHGRIAPPSSTHGTSLVDPSSSSGLLGLKPGCNACLICQLHQNFSATLISVKLEAQPLPRLTHLSRTTPTSVSSTAHHSLSGRAPPQAN